METRINKYRLPVAGMLLLLFFVGTDAVCATWEIGVVDAAGNAGAYCELAIDSSGNMHTVYLRQETGELMVTSTVGISWQSPERADTSGSVGGYCAVAVTGAVQRRLAYYRSDTGALWYAGPEAPME